MIRQHSLTRWMSRDLAQAAVDFCRNLGLLPVYTEASSDHLTRYLFWSHPKGEMLEVRSGRTQDVFEKFDAAARNRNSRLLTLHISEGGLYSAVWISAEGFEIAKLYLAAHGITTAESHDA